MRRIWTVLAMGFVVTLLSCDLVNTERGGNMVMLASSFPDGVTSLHVAVYDASQEPPVLLSYQVLYSGSALSVNAPAGPRRVFAVWGEGPAAGIATHYGVNGPVDVENGGTVSVPVTMRRFSDAAAPTVFAITIPETGKMAWNRIYGTDTYEVWGRYNNMTSYQPRIMLYLGPNERYTQGNYINLGVTAHSSLFGLVSEEGF